MTVDCSLASSPVFSAAGGEFVVGCGCCCGGQTRPLSIPMTTKHEELRVVSYAYAAITHVGLFLFPCPLVIRQKQYLTKGNDMDQEAIEVIQQYVRAANERHSTMLKRAELSATTLVGLMEMFLPHQLNLGSLTSPQIAALNHPAMTDEAISVMLPTVDYTISPHEVARDKEHISEELYGFLVEKYGGTWTLLANRNDCPLRYQLQFADSLYVDTRIVMARNVSASQEALESMRADRDDYVRFTLMLNASVSSELREQLFATGTPFDWDYLTHGVEASEHLDVANTFADYLTAKMAAYRADYGLEDLPDSFIAEALWGVKDSPIRLERSQLN